jgi:thiol-disulfide isomerase/thioredoxin
MPGINICADNKIIKNADKNLFKRFLSAFFILSSLSVLGQQTTTIEISGMLKGDHVGKIYLFFEDNIREKDSISSNIINGIFRFKCDVTIPVLARIHLDNSSLIQDFYIDQKQTYLDCTNKFKMLSQKDTLNWLMIDSVKGSKMEEEMISFLRTFHTRFPNEIAKRDSLVYYDKLSAYAEQHPASKISAYLISQSSFLSYSRLHSLYAKLDTVLNPTYEMSEVFIALRASEKQSLGLFNEGMPFHNIILPDIEDRKINTEEIRGKYLLLVCWASWCAPCRNESPLLKEFFNKYKDRGLTMVGISFDHIKSKWINAINEDGLQSWIQLMDARAYGGDLANYYSLQGIPMLFLLDENKKIIVAGSFEQIKNKIESLLN